jgi:hypothetical protein
VAYLGYIGSPYQPPGPAPASLATTNTCFISDGAGYAVTEIADNRHWQLVSPASKGFVILYLRRAGPPRQ